MAAYSKILLVEDHNDIRQMMAVLLKRSGHTVVQAATVAEGIASTADQSIALLDLSLPDGLGTEVFKHIRKQHHHTRIAFTTAALDLDAVKSLLGPGDQIFTKPIHFNELIQWINQPGQSH